MMRKTVLTGALLLAGVTMTSTGASAQYYGGGYGYGSPRYYSQYDKERAYAISQYQKERRYAAAQYYKERAYNQALRWKYGRGGYGYGYGYAPYGY